MRVWAHGFREYWSGGLERCRREGQKFEVERRWSRAKSDKEEKIFEEERIWLWEQ